MASGRGLTLLSGPANAGKVALLLERYLGALDRDPVLIVPHGSDVERIERELLAQSGALLSGDIGTFDDVFERIARAGGSSNAVATDAQRQLIIRTAVSATSLNGLGASSRFTGFADALGTALAELESGLVEPADLRGDLALLYTAYRAELDKLGLWDRDLLRRHAADRVAGELDAWSGRPVFAYGFEDLTGAQWALLEALAGRTEVTVSLPYEPNRAPFESLARTSRGPQLARRRAHRGARASVRRGRPAGARTPRAPPVRGRPAAGSAARRLDPVPGRSRCARHARARRGRSAEADPRRNEAGRDPHRLPERRPPAGPARDRADCARSAVRDRGAHPDRQDVVRPGAPLVPALRVARGRAPRPVRLPPLAVLRPTRAHVDYLEGRLRGRAVSDPERVVEETLKLRGQPLRVLDDFRADADPLAAVRKLVGSMIRAAYGLDSPPVGEDAVLDLRAHRAVTELLEELARLDRARRRALPRRAVRRPRPRIAQARPRRRAGKVAVTDLLRARTRRTEVVFLLGLEEGSFPAAAARLAVLGRRGAARDRRDVAARALDEAGCGLPRALPLLHGVHAAVAPPLPRSRGLDRRRLAARGEPVLGGGRGALRSAGRGPLDEPQAAGAAHVGARQGADRPRAAPGAKRPRSRRPGGRG